MKKFILLVSLLILSFGKLISQNADCINAILLCSNPNFTFNSTQGNGNVADLPGTNSISNPATNPNPPNSGCLLAGENHPQWLLISIGNAGMLEFIFGAGNSPNPQAGFYDWAMWPYSPNACSDIMNNLLPPIRCNWNAVSSGGTGIASASNIPSGGSQGNFESPLAVNACDQFIICISNYSNVNTLVSFLSLGTASLSCNPSCANFEICAGNNVTITPINVANLTGTTYSLNPGGLVNTTGTFVVSPLTSQTYSSYITGVNTTNAIITTSAIISVIVNPQPTLSPTYTLSTCTSTASAFDLHLSFNPATPAPSYTVNWGSIPNNINTNQQTSATGVLAGSYPVTVTAQGGCQATANVSISPQPAQATFTFIPLGTNHYTVTCAQPTLNIMTTNSILNYTWTNINTGNLTGTNTSVSTANLGNWTVTAVHPVSQCSATHTFNVGQNFTPPVIGSLNPVLQSITCANSAIQTVTATASSPTTNITHSFMSDVGGTVNITSNPAIFQPGPGNYIYQLTNNENGCSVSQTFSVLTSPDFPTLQISSTGTLAGQGNYTIGCNNHSLTVINIVNANTNPTPGGALQFGFIQPNQGPGYTATSAQFSVVSMPGTWTVVVKSINNSCETRVPVTIIQNTTSPNISAVVPLQILDCATPSTTLLAQTTNSNATFNWLLPGLENLPSSTVAVNTTTNPSSTSVGNYTLSITDQDNGCISNSVVPMQQNLFAPTASVSVTSKTITCVTTTLQLSNSSTTGIPPASGFPTSGIIQAMLWQGPVPQPSLSLSSSYVAGTPGVYTLTVRDSNNGCTSSKTLTIDDGRIYPVIINQPAQPPFVLDCGNQNVAIYPNMTSTNTAYTYVWLGPTTNTFTGSSSTRTVNVNATGLYKVVVTDPSNGCGTAGGVSVINGTLTAELRADKTQGYAPLEVTFYNYSTSGLSNSSITTVWSFGNGLDSTTRSASIPVTQKYTQPGTYTVNIYATKGECLASSSKVIQVDIPSKLEVPNVFTPNGDGVNDLFFLKTANLTEIHMIIYDRWGHITYELQSETGNIAWDGKNLYGKDAAEGSYFYIITAKGKDGQDFNTKGVITLTK